MAERTQVHSDCETKILKEGYVKVRSHGIFSKWKKRWLILKDANDSGKTLMLLKSHKHVDQPYSNQPILLKNLDTLDIIELPGQRWGLSLHLKDGFEQLMSLESEVEAREWHKNLTANCIYTMTEGESKLDKDNDKESIDDLLENESPDCKNTIADCIEQFSVSLHPSAKLQFSGQYNLQITPEYIEVCDTEDPNMKLVSWPIISMRRFGFDTSKFTFEAGRRCETGEGIFVFSTSDGERIHKLVQTYAEELASRTRSYPPANNNDCDETELRPLPPIPPE